MNKIIYPSSASQITLKRWEKLSYEIRNYRLSYFQLNIVMRSPWNTQEQKNKNGQQGITLSSMTIYEKKYFCRGAECGNGAKPVSLIVSLFIHKPSFRFSIDVAIVVFIFWWLYFSHPFSMHCTTWDLNLSWIGICLLWNYNIHKFSLKKGDSSSFSQAVLHLYFTHF